MGCRLGLGSSQDTGKGQWARDRVLVWTRVNVSKRSVRGRDMGNVSADAGQGLGGILEERVWWGHGESHQACTEAFTLC